MPDFERTERTLSAVAEALNQVFNPDETSRRKVGFVLLTFDMGEMKEVKAAPTTSATALTVRIL